MINILSKNKYSVLGHLTFITLIIFAICLAAERVLLIDSAYQLFYDINNESMLINDKRYSMFLSQIIPWILIKLHAPLWCIIVGYSVSFVIVGYILYIVAVHVLKNEKAGLLMIFMLFCMRHTFFHCISETFQLMYLASFLFAWIYYSHSEKTASKIMYYAMMAIITALCIYIHPIALFFVLFIICFRFVDGNFKIDAKIIASTLIFILLVAIKLMLTESNSHDSSFIPSMDELKFAITNFFSTYSYIFFISEKFYIYPTIILALCSIFYIRKKLWWKLSFIVLFNIAFFAMSIIVYYKGDGPIGMERSFLPLLFFTGLPFVKDLMPALKPKTDMLVFVAIAAVTVISFVRIGNASTNYTYRLEQIEKISALANQENKHKLIITKSTAGIVFPINIWGLAIESMMYTAAKDPENTVTIYMEEDDFDTSSPEYYSTDTYLCVPWWRNWNISELNSNYFRLPPQQYYLVKYTDEQYSFPQLSDNKLLQRENNINRIISNIKNDPEWLKYVEEQAKEKGISLEQNLRENAIWVIDEMGE